MTVGFLSPCWTLTYKHFFKKILTISKLIGPKLTMIHRTRYVFSLYAKIPIFTSVSSLPNNA